MRVILHTALVAGCIVSSIAGCSSSARQESPHGEAEGPPAAAAPPVEVWADPGTDSVTVGDLEARITGARIGKARLTQAFTPGQFPQTEDDLIVYVHLKNRSRTKKVDHNGWSMWSYGPSRPKLTDEWLFAYSCG
jgi:hypothetical protein